MSSAAPLPNVFQYIDFRRFLLDWFEAKKKSNPRFSHRGFARLAGQKSPSSLLHVMRGQRNLTGANQAAFAKAMKLTEAESEFFGLLVKLGQATSDKERSEAWERIRATQRFLEARRVDGAAFECLTQWYYTAIRELAHRPGFVAEAEWVAARLRPQIDPTDAQRALDVLFEFELLARDADGTIHVTDATVVTAPEVAGLAVHDYHYGMLERAREAVERFEPEERLLCGSTMAVPEHLLEQVRREVLALHERVLNICDSEPAVAGRVYQLSVALFPLSDRPGSS